MPDWISEIAEVWGTPRYAILRVYRGLIECILNPDGNIFKPSAIPTADIEEHTPENKRIRRL